MKPSRPTTMYLETTEVPAERSMAEIASVLVQAGALEIATTYEGGVPAGVRWRMMLYDRPVWFILPAKVDPVYNALYKRRVSGRGRLGGIDTRKLRDTARRVAWRQLLTWVKVQMAMIEHGMAEYGQVFLPYVDSGGGRTAWDHFRETNFKMIEAPKDADS